MDARERLRLYLEQRRELGESELVLDQLPVDDVLALLGARTVAAPRPTRRSHESAPASSPASGASRPVADASTGGPPASEVPAASTEAPPAAPPPPAAAARFDPNATDRDWRARLRAVDAAPEGVRAAPPVTTSATTPSSPPASGGEPPAASAPSDSAPTAAPTTPTAARAASAPAWLTALELPLGLQVGEGLARPAADRSLADVERAIAGCAACALGASALNHVPGEGNPAADFVCVGEAPGQTEDETGRPFVGAAGQLLTKILGAIKLAREDVFICNVLKHRPPGNRTPTPDEVRACRPFLEQQLALVQPRVILALGTSAAHALLETTQSLGALRGRIHRYHGIPVVVTYHPAALLRNEAWKRPTWEDVQLARRILDAARAASAS